MLTAGLYGIARSFSSASVDTDRSRRTTWSTSLTMQKTSSSFFGSNITQRDSTRHPNQSKPYHHRGIRWKRHSHSAPTRISHLLFHRIQRCLVRPLAKSTLINLNHVCHLPILTSCPSFLGRLVTPRSVVLIQFKMQMHS